MEQLKSSKATPDVISDKFPGAPYNLIRIPVKYLADIWVYVLPTIEKGLTANPNMNLDDVLNGLIDESIQLWVVMKQQPFGRTLVAAFLTSIERDVTEGGEMEWVLSLYGLGGAEPRAWVMLCHQTMHRFARGEDCKRVRMCGRPAWQRILPGYRVVGEKQGHLVYERAVDTSED